MEAVEVHEKPFKCPKCDTRFLTEKNIKRHIELKHSLNPTNFKCWFCGKVYQNKANYKVHWKKDHQSEFLLYLEPREVKVLGEKIKIVFISHS